MSDVNSIFSVKTEDLELSGQEIQKYAKDLEDALTEFLELTNIIRTKVLNEDLADDPMKATESTIDSLGEFKDELYKAGQNIETIGSNYAKAGDSISNGVEQA